MLPMTYSIRDVAELLGLGRTTIYKLINEGGLTRIKVGARTLISAAEVQALLTARPA